MRGARVCRERRHDHGEHDVGTRAYDLAECGQRGVGAAVALAQAGKERRHRGVDRAATEVCLHSVERTRRSAADLGGVVGKRTAHNRNERLFV